MARTVAGAGPRVRRRARSAPPAPPTPVAGILLGPARPRNRGLDTAGGLGADLSVEVDGRCARPGRADVDGHEQRHRRSSTSNQLMGLQLVTREGQQGPVERTGAVVAARIEGHRPADPAEPGGLVHVAVEPAIGWWLSIAARTAVLPTGPSLTWPACWSDGQVGVEDRRLIESAVKRGHVGVEHDAVRVARLREQLLEVRRRARPRSSPGSCATVSGSTSPRTPARARRPSGSTRPSACSPQGAFCSGSTERRRIVVAEHPERRLAQRPQALVGHLHPALQPLAHQVEQQFVHRAVGDPRVELARLRAPRVVADVGDARSTCASSSSVSMS